MEYFVERVDPLNPFAVHFLDHLQGLNAFALGFLPFQALEEAISRGRVLQAFENGEPCGYMIHGKPRENTRILQTVVANDARRIQHATALVDALKIIANSVQAHMISLHCAEDLEANRFWEAIGFERTGRRLRNKRRTRWQIAYQIELPGKKLAAIMQAKRIEQAGVSSLHRLLVKGDARIGEVDIAKNRSTRHSFELD